MGKYIVLIVACLFVFVSVACSDAVKIYSDVRDLALNSASSSSSTPVGSDAGGSGVNQGFLEVYFVDVGQGDCAIYRYNDKYNMIIDAGSGTASVEVIKFIKKLGIDHFDVVIATHPDEDHIGSLDDVINTFGTDKVYAPKITKDTVAFGNFAEAVQRQGIKITPPVSGDSFYLGDVMVRILAPNSASYDATNNYSLVTRSVLGPYSFLNMGDAETLSEKEILFKGYELQTNVMKIGHHGSSSSTSKLFFSSVNPQYSVVSVGKDNKYGHPDQGVWDRISISSTAYRTDLDGTISFSTDKGDGHLLVWTSK